MSKPVWQPLSDVELVKRLSLPEGKIDMVLDTDTYNEVDDQFALAYALLSPERLNVQAVYAAPFHNNRSSGPADGMQRSYDEIADILDVDLGTVKSRINRGRKQLRKFLLQSGNFSGFSPSKDTGEEGCR